MNTQQARRKRGRPSNAELALRRKEAAGEPTTIPTPPAAVCLLTSASIEVPVMPEPPSAEESVGVPPSWTKGQLLNVRNAGECYVITLLGEEFDSRYPERALKFTNQALCQNFISSWYAREHFDPRAR